jgi:hypothetical protein
MGAGYWMLVVAKRRSRLAGMLDTEKMKLGSWETLPFLPHSAFDVGRSKFNVRCSLVSFSIT